MREVFRMEVEIAKYPCRCYGCGKSGMVRVLADSGYPIKTEMSTVRVPPDGWEWRFADGMPRWVCDECLGVSDE